MNANLQFHRYSYSDIYFEFKQTALYFDGQKKSFDKA